MNSGVPIIVGVTGHIDIFKEDKEYIETSFIKQLDKIQILHPNSEIIVCSGLANGIDTLVIEAAVANGNRYIGLLPMALDEYYSDFDSIVECEYNGITFTSEKERLKHLCEHAYVLKEGPYNELPKDKLDDRDAKYVDLGHELAEVSDYLIAFMHPESDNIIGGTKYVVDVRLNGKNDPSYCHELLKYETPVRNAIVINIGRKKIGPISKEEKKVEYLGFKNSKIDKIENVDYINKLIVKQGEEITHEYEGVTYNIKREPVKYIQTLADGVSLRYRNLKSRFMTVFLLLAMIGLISFELFGIWSNYYLLLVYVASYSVLLILYFFVYRQIKYHEKFTEFRTVSELLMILDVWKQSDLSETVSGCLPLKSRETMGWIMGVIQSIELVYESNYELKISDEKMDTICNEWMSGQKKFYGDKTEKHRIALKNMEKITMTIFGLSLLLLVGVVLISAFGIKLSSDEFNLALAISGLSTAVVALYAGRVQVTSFNEMLDRYIMMEKVYDRGSLMYKKLHEKENSSKEKRLIVKTIGQEAINELSDWLYFQRDRDGKFFV